MSGRSSDRDGLPEGGFAGLAPELSVTDLPESLRFWCDVLGFRVAYARPENGFADLQRERAQVMLEAINERWETGALARPFGRGINLQIEVTALAPILVGLEAVGWPLFKPPHEAWYRAGRYDVGLRQCLVQDPDGYLLRFAETLGVRQREV
ncbi:VOC family protein [Methylorubrum populi]|uniref:bleomycin resistance protein n=1 Tax=Methylorubrum populi TaxID=223967 RepID=UPI0031F9DB6D